MICPLSSGSLRHPGSNECFLWMKTMKKPCSLITWNKFRQSVAPPHQRTPTPMPPQLRPLVPHCRLVDEARAERPMAAERAVPYFIHVSWETAFPVNGSF